MIAWARKKREGIRRQMMVSDRFFDSTPRKRWEWLEENDLSEL